MKLKWIEKDIYLVADNCKYLIKVYKTGLGLKADLIDYSFFTVRSNISIKYAKRIANELTKRAV